MSNRIAAKGHTHVIAVLDMKQCIAKSHLRREFEYIRGSEGFATMLTESWTSALAHQKIFVPMPKNEGLSVEDVGFATGVFRPSILRKHSMPTYRLDKDKVTFPHALETNFQFKTLFRRVWDRWEICVRPTSTGFFVIRLNFEYEQTPRSLIELAKDVVRLQEPLDVPSAVKWLAYNQDRFKDQPEMLMKKEASVRTLLKWLGANVAHPEQSRQLYYPVQWKLALEAINRFVGATTLDVPFRGGAVPLEPVPPQYSMPLHDSYIIYHFDSLLVDADILGFGARRKKSRQAKVEVTTHTIRKSNKIRNALVNLMEGTVLKEPMEKEGDGEGNSAEEDESNGYFPSPRWSLADAFVQDPTFNMASWNDEVCVFTPRTALIMPSQRWRDHKLAVSTTPSATLTVDYREYWEAIERMVEFVLEVRVLAQLIEEDSYDLLTEMAQTVDLIRTNLFDGAVELSDELKEQMERAAHLRRIAALAQSLSHPQYWSRAEFATQKADRLLDLLDVPRIFDHIAHNIDSINVATDHVDELYIAYLAEQNNGRATRLSINLALVSFVLAILVLPSFWADWIQVVDEFGWNSQLDWGGFLSGLAIAGMVLAGLFVMAFKRHGNA